MRKKNFTPFLHEDLEAKNVLLDYARLSAANEEHPAARLGGAVIYASLAEYLAEHLLENLKHFTQQSTYTSYAGIIYFNDAGKEEKPRTLGQTIHELRKYRFPSDTEIIGLLVDISNARNNVLHNFIKISESSVGALTSDISSLISDTEELLIKINVIYAGLQKVLVPQEVGSQVSDDADEEIEADDDQPDKEKSK